MNAVIVLCSIGAIACNGDPGAETYELQGEDEVAGEPDLELVSPGLAEADSPGLELMMEAEACTVLVETYGLHGLDIGCPTTIKSCPGLFRDSFGVPCMQYQRHSIESCRDNIEAATTCDEIRETACEIAPVWGSEPLGCDEPG